ncbi:MAG: hypothetical protein HFF01_09720 [Erysipelotrichaceae bacterium]|nr:hypothetical protein [Erysipelotrichaceae bacterium]MCI9525282.1 hypothetical protein [Erysipelotrichaceae bacterium]
MRILLIYKSKTGFTEKYANWITEELNCDIAKISHIQKINFGSYDLVIFGSRIHAGRVDGLNKIKKLNLGKKLIIFATGATPKETNSIMEVWNSNLNDEELKNIKHFYIPAGLNYEKMGFLDKTMMKMASKMLEKKNNKCKEDVGMQNSIKKSYDISSKERIKPLIEYVKSL